jgi:hypothetical protein
MVAGVGAVAAVGVAFWNSRGESAELRQLKAMNEALTGMAESDESLVFLRARNGLAVRVAARVDAAPRRRRVAWITIAVIGAIAIVTAAVVLFAPFLPAWVSSQAASATVSIVTAVVTLLVALVGMYLTEKRTAARAQRDARDLLARMMEAARAASSDS